ncbi:transposase, partial [Methylobacterium sp. PvP062]
HHPDPPTLTPALRSGFSRARDASGGGLHRTRTLVERFFSKIKHFRAVATRYDKDPDNFLASVKLAALRVWLRA